MKTVYKVVNSCYSSICASKGRGSKLFCPVKYEVGKEVSAPKGTRLFVFEDLQNARAWAREVPFAPQIFKAQAKGISRPAVIPSNVTHIDAFWEARSKKKNPLKDLRIKSSLSAPPGGTLFAKSVTLLEKVY